ncbi:MAG: right-handed parallel beta-helix repeat-containing protein [Phycisphaerales bacterium]|nr:right-handed parallel beta-helix repeat-containing protein [Phycisphaerales bacterium]
MKINYGVTIALVISCVCYADTWTVDDDGKADFNTIQAAIDASNNGDLILVHAGTYTSNQGSEVVNLLGKTITLQSVSGPTKTIIDGSGKQRGILCVNGESNATTIEGFTIQNCVAPWLDWDGDQQVDQWEYSGAGMGCKLSDPTINNCVFQNNNASQNGGGIMNYESHPNLTSCSFDNNIAGSLGGGMYNFSNSNTNISNCTFISNAAQFGGGIYNRYLSNSIIANSTIQSNIASSGGGGMYNSAQSTLTLLNSTVSQNQTTTIDGFGGGLVFFNSNITLSDCTIENNIANADGGGIYGTVGSFAEIVNCEISQNECSDAGAGMFFSYLISATIDNSIIQHNSDCEFGGGLYLYDTVDIELNNTDIQHNNSSNSGGGFWSSRHNTIQLHESTIDDNEAPFGNDFLAERDSLVQFSGSNHVGDLEILFTGTKIEFLPDSHLTISGSLTPPAKGAIAFDIGNLDASPPLTITGELIRQGSLSITNYSNSLNNADVGDLIPLMQVANLSESLFNSVVVPEMPSGKGLRVVSNNSLQGDGIIIAGEVIEIEDVEFDDPALLGLDSPPVNIVSCDIDGDGSDEVAILYSGFPGTVALFAMSDDGTPTYIEGSLTTVGNVPVDLDAGDINDDGIDEILVANSIDSTLSLLQNQTPFRANPTITEKIIPVSGSFQALTSAAIIDWDDDGSLDAVAGVDQLDEAVEDRYQVIINLEDESPMHSATFNIPMYTIYGEEVSDAPLTVDGINETAFGFVAGTSYGRVHRATFGRSELSLLGDLDGNRIMYVELSELDDGKGDGQLDIVVASDEAESVFLFQGNRSEPDGFGDIISMNVTLHVRDVVAIDADSDGDTDFIVTAPESDDPLVLLRNDGVAGLLPPGLTGRTWSKQTMASDNPPMNIASGGLNGKDEDDDWVAGAGNQNSALTGDSGYSLEQTNLIAPPCHTDMNGDGTINVDDLLLVIGAWGNCNGCQEDLNNDGFVNVDDLLIIIGEWGVCP